MGKRLREHNPLCPVLAMGGCDKEVIIHQSLSVARASLGGIDLDPASCELANETVGARRFYDIKQDGLKRSWFGNIFLNPPYSRFGPPFVRKAVVEFKSGRTEQAIILLNVNHIATHWFNDATQVEHLICLPRKRINYTSPIHITSSPTSASVLIGIGVDRERFIEHFGPLGGSRLCRKEASHARRDRSSSP